MKSFHHYNLQTNIFQVKKEDKRVEEKRLNDVPSKFYMYIVSTLAKKDFFFGEKKAFRLSCGEKHEIFIFISV